MIGRDSTGGGFGFSFFFSGSVLAGLSPFKLSLSPANCPPVRTFSFGFSFSAFLSVDLVSEEAAVAAFLSSVEAAVESSSVVAAVVASSVVESAVESSVVAASASVEAAVSSVVAAVAFPSVAVAVALPAAVALAAAVELSAVASFSSTTGSGFL